MPYSQRGYHGGVPTEPRLPLSNSSESRKWKTQRSQRLLVDFIKKDVGFQNKLIELNSGETRCSSILNREMILPYTARTQQVLNSTQITHMRLAGNSF